MPVIVPMNMSFLNYCALNLMPGWGADPDPARPRAHRAAARPRDAARMMVERANSEEAGMFRRLADFGGYVIGDTYSAAERRAAGRVVRDIAAERGDDDPFDTLHRHRDRRRPAHGAVAQPPDDDDAHWALRRTLWDDPDVMLGGSDAGAHLDRMCGGSYPTQFLADTLRGRKLVPLERAVQMHHRRSRRGCFGLRDRGTVVEGAHADLVVFDPDDGRERAGHAGRRPARRRSPHGGRRRSGSQRVLVNGVETVLDGEATGALPGTVLRSGRDTDTVTVH